MKREVIIYDAILFLSQSRRYIPNPHAHNISLSCKDQPADGFIEILDWKRRLNAKQAAH